jgi:hypothetical protein
MKEDTMEKTAKVNEKYGIYGLTKVDNVTTLLNHGINDYPEETKVYLANYGMFVAASRTHAATKECPMTDDEKKQAFIDIDQWFMDGCPKRERAAKADAFITACRKVMTSDQSLKVRQATVKALEAAYGRQFDE